MAPQSQHRIVTARVAALVAGVALLGGAASAAGSPTAAHREVHLQAGDTARVMCTHALSVTSQTAQEMRLACGGTAPLPTATPPAVATATPVVPATATPPLATATPLPPTATATRTVTPASTATIPPPNTATAIPPPPASATPLPTDVPTPVAPTIEGVAICAHDPDQWHGLVERNADNSIRCTHGHTHFDDPRALDGAMGPLPAYMQGRSISYPWETPAENANKHRVYKWMTYANPLCESLTNERTLRYARVQYHGDANGGALTRFHSYWAQLEWCDPTDPAFAGRWEHGGWLDYGRLFVLTNAGDTYVPLPDDPPPSARRRTHGSPERLRPDWTWYGESGTRFNIGLRNEDWGPLDPNRPNDPVLFYGTVGATTYNHSRQAVMHLISVVVATNRTTYSGYTNRYGVDVAGCTAVGLDCVPLLITGMPSGESQFRGEERQARLPMREYDEVSPHTGRSLVQYPN